MIALEEWAWRNRATGEVSSVQLERSAENVEAASLERECSVVRGTTAPTGDQLSKWTRRRARYLLDA